MSGFLDAPSPRWFTIGAHRPFLEDLAAGIWKTLSPLGQEVVADAVVLLPTRRAARDLAEAFLKASGTKAVLLPQIRALGDLDEGEPPFEAGDVALDLLPPIAPLQRRFELAGLVVEHEGLLERRLDAGAALELADALATFLDSCQIEETGDEETVNALVEGDLAQHWRVSANFLSIALKAWPERLAALGLMDVAARRVALLRRLETRWRDRPPSHFLIAAGSTGSAKATADLLAVIAAAPHGCVVLPGLDKSLADSAWNQVEDQHPQGNMRRLLEGAGLTRGQVAYWDPATETTPAGRWRRRVINEALRPPDATADWLQTIKDIRSEGVATGVDPIAEGLKGLSLITSSTEEEEAAVVALLLREALQEPSNPRKTVALITPDAAVARRVSARLTRWAITADSSAGHTLAAEPAAVLASLVARAVADPVNPVTLLSILKHPLTQLRMESKDLRRAGRTLERYGLRGPRSDGWQTINERLQGAVVRAREADERSQTGINELTERVEAAANLGKLLRDALALAEAPHSGAIATPAEAARGLTETLEALAAGSRSTLGNLWSGQGGESLGGLLSALIEGSSSLPQVTRAAFSELLDALLARETVRPGGASHPRLRILGVLEARLLRADLMVLAGLEEGMWPAGAPIDPFLSRPMRDRLGLPSPERRIGLSAHDFAQAACAPEVVLINSERRGGAPTVASRWLWRLRTLLRGASLVLPGRPEIIAWARALDAPLADPPDSLKTASRPRPTPPFEARPRKLAVTAVERWVRDPYGLYAREILQLRQLDRPDAAVEAMARGTAIHKAFENFAKDHPGDLPPDAEEAFATLLLNELLRAGMPRAKMAREAALAANAARWVIDFERRHRSGAQIIVEEQGEIQFKTYGGDFTLTAKADRIEVKGDVADILDVKTGAAPSAKQVKAGLAPQLTLTAAILAAGGFAKAKLASGDLAHLGRIGPGDLLYVRVSGGRLPGREESHGEGNAPALAAEALARLKRRVEQFENPSTPYLSWAIPQFIGLQGDDYDHLARLWEWYVVGEGDGEGGE